MLVELAWADFFRVDASRCVDELLDRDVAVTTLAIEVPALRGRVLLTGGPDDIDVIVWRGVKETGESALERVVPRFPGLVDRDIVSAVSLIDGDIALS